MDATRVLVDNGSNIDAKDYKDATPLHKAVFMGHLKQCEVLIQLGANPKAKDVDGETPLDYAKQKGHAEILRLFDSV